ncbi:hypothetical protein MBLNU459_g6943t1 [Dothideomycetes sp. NU459]
MSGPAFIAELNSLAQEAKRKNPEIRTAAEKSLQELKALPNTSEQQLAADLSRRPSFIEPFLLACASRNPKYAGSAANCLQRLVIIKGLPKTRLKEVLDAFNACTSLSLEIQLKVLQALPALAQSYSDDLKGEQLTGALQVCAALQNAKAATISGVAAATLQQLVVSVFDKVAVEDTKAQHLPIVAEVPASEKSVPLREAAYDAYRVFLDICLATEGRKPKFVQFANLSSASGLELVWACMNTHSQVFATHTEQTDIIRSLVLPFLIRVISERQGFGITLRAIRVASLVIRQHLQAMPDECEMILGLLTHMLDPEAAASWKRAMCMEVYRSIYTEQGLALQVYLQYDAQDGKKNIIRDNIATFVRLSTEKPSAIGLGQQSSVPTGPLNQKEVIQEQAVVEAAGGVAGVIGAALGVGDANIPGISTQWSVPKTQCIDQLDKTEPPSLPETYVYSLVLESLNGLSENLAKVVLPLTVQHEHAKPRKPRVQGNGGADDLDSELGSDTPPPSQPPKVRARRSQSYRARAVPLNPLSSEQGPPSIRIKAIANLVEECWPALLATFSTFLYAALDNDYYRALIRSYQRFIQVSGLLRLTTARDALLTTLSKSAVPPNMVNASLSGPLSPITESPSIYQNAKGLLSVESFTNQSPAHDKMRHTSGDHIRPTLTTRNLLCLRALLNVAIAIGPTLGSSFTIIFEALQQAGVVLNSMGSQQRDSQSSSRTGSEVAAVEAATLRLFESTADYPNDAFLFVLTTLSKLLDGKSDSTLTPITEDAPSPLPSPRLGRRISSLPGISNESVLGPQDYLFVLTRLGELSDLNVSRFTNYNASESGWKILAGRLVEVSISATTPNDARRLAADILRRCAVAIAELSTAGDEDEAAAAQKLALSSLQMLIRQMYAQSDELTSIDVEIHAKILDAVRSILEKSGESLTAGWDIILAILSSVFDDDDDGNQSSTPTAKSEESWLHLSSQIIAPYLGRSAFGAMQLICSDFLASLPENCLSPLIEILYHFTSQDVDLNISLTTITLFWDVSDFLVKQKAVQGLNAAAENTDDADAISDERAEVRNSAFQTILRIFNNHGDDFSTAAWQLSLETLLLRILQENVTKQETIRAEKVNAAIIALDSTTRALLEDSAALISQNLSTITPSSSFYKIWRALIALLRTYLSFRSSAVSAAVFNALATILRSVAADDDKWRTLIDETSSLWAADIPGISGDVKGQDFEQEAYLAYVDCGAQIYRLTEQRITADQIMTIAKNLVECVRSSRGSYGVDANSPTPLQTGVLQLLKMLRTDVDTVPSTLIKTASSLITLPFEKERSIKLKSSLTFVALAKLAMDWLIALVPSHISLPDVFTSGAIALSLECLEVPMKLKYGWKQNGKAPAPWQKATPTALSIIEPSLSQMQKLDLDQDVKTRIWAAIVGIAQAIMNADLGDAGTAPSLEVIEDDESSDCENLTRLRNMIVPLVGSASILPSIREAYISSLFHASIIHAPERGDVPSSDALLTDIYSVRLGRVRDPLPSAREAMAYLCLTELLALSAQADAAIAAPERVELAKVAVPSLVVRLALPLKAYIADQPLRGSMSQPLSQKEELLFCLQAMQTLRCEPAAAVGISRTNEPNSKIHLEVLYLLTVRAVGIAGDRRHGNSKVLEALQRVLEVAGSDRDT